MKASVWTPVKLKMFPQFSIRVKLRLIAALPQFSGVIQPLGILFIFSVPVSPCFLLVMEVSNKPLNQLLSRILSRRYASSKKFKPRQIAVDYKNNKGNGIKSKTAIL